MPPDGDVRARLKEKVEDADLALTLKTRDSKTPQWASANIELADALYALAAEEDDRIAFIHYQQAITAYEAALKVYTDKDYPQEWRAASLSLAKTLRSYALREGGNMGRLCLERARQRIEDMMETFKNYGDISSHGVLYIELAHIHRVYADTEHTDKRRTYLEATIAAFAQAARIFKGKEQFDSWAASLAGQAAAWRELAERAGKESLDALHQAAGLFKSALSYYNSEQHCFDRIYIHFEYGRTLLRIALGSAEEHRHDTASAAIDIFRAALKATSTQDAPDLWLRLRTELGLALLCLAHCPQTRNSSALFEEAAQIYQAAASHYAENAKPLDSALMQGNLGKSLMALATITKGEESQAWRIKAIEALQKSISPALKNERRSEWIANLIELGTAFHLTANHNQTEKRFALYQEAMEIYREALRLTEKDNEPELQARLQGWIGLTSAYLGENDESETGLRRLKEAELAFRLAMTFYEKKHSSPEYIRLQSNIGNLLYTMARRSDDEQADIYLRDARQAMLQTIQNLDNRDFPSEWSTAQWNYGLIIKHTIIRGLSRQTEEDYDRAADAFRHALDCRSVDNAFFDNFNIKHALASLLLMRATHLLKATDCSYLQEALALFSEIHDWAKQNGHADIAQQIDTEMKKAIYYAAPRKPSGFLKKVRSLFKKTDSASA